MPMQRALPSATLFSQPLHLPELGLASFAQLLWWLVDGNGDSIPMAPLSLGFRRERRFSPFLEHDRFFLRAPELQDYDEWAALREASRAHLTEWEPDWTDDDVSLEAFRRKLKSQERQRMAGQAMPLLVFDTFNGQLMGGVNLTNIRFFASCSASIGYWIGAPFLRCGNGLGAVTAVVAYAFGTLGLNRIEAACQPGNQPSRKLLEKAGFGLEGLARDYLFINGAWRDHSIYAIVASDTE